MAKTAWYIALTDAEWAAAQVSGYLPQTPMGYTNLCKGPTQGSKKVGDDFVVQAILLRVMYEPAAADSVYSDSMQGESVKTATAIPVNSDVSVLTRHFANGPKKPPAGSSS